MLNFITVEGDLISVPKDKIACFMWQKDTNQYWVNIINSYEFEVTEEVYIKLHEQYGGMGG